MNLQRTIATRLAFLFVFACAATVATVAQTNTVDLPTSTVNQCDVQAPVLATATTPMMCVKGVWTPTTVGFDF